MSDVGKPIDPGSIRNILVVKPSSLGDIVHTFPALELLRRHCPGAELDFVVIPALAPLLDYSPFPIRDKILFRRRELGQVVKFVPETWKLLRRLRRHRYDLVIDFQGLFRSALISGLAAPRRRIAGFADTREKGAAWFYGRQIQTTSEHAVPKNVELVNRLFGTEAPVPELEIAVGKNLPPPLMPDYLLLFPGARWPSKKFPESLFAEIAAAAVDRGLTVVLSGSADEESCCRNIASKISAAPGKVVSLAGKTTMSDLFKLCGNAKAVICNDSGPLHIAALLRRPVFAFFGSTCPEKTGPWGATGRVVRRDLDCLGCLKRTCPRPGVPCQQLDFKQAADEILRAVTGSTETRIVHSTATFDDITGK